MATVLEYTNQHGERRRVEYNSESVAVKIARWLTRRGATEMTINGREYGGK